MMDKQVIAVYLRLSGEDKEKGADESNSITNQRQLILDYIQSDKTLSKCEAREFVDDGVSGARFDRKAFQEMIRQAGNGEIQTIITKDYSRLGRDYLEVGKYMECLFPLLHVRYIAVNEHYDSNDYIGKTGGMATGIKNIINMMYSRDASQKVMAARKVLTEQGKFIGSFAPYGYVKSPADKHKLIPDPEAAQVVKQIFTLAAEGKKYKEIARILNESGVETCLDYQKSHGRERKHSAEIKVHQWSATTVMDILYSEVYIGTIVNNRTALNRRTGYKAKRRNPDEWTVVENCHEPIVSRELYEAAHEKLNRKKQAKSRRSCSTAGRLFLCGCCGHALIKRNGRYKCPANLNPAELNCSKVKMDAEVFENTVLAYIRTTAESFLQDLEKKKREQEAKGNEPDMEVIRQKIRQLENRRFQAYDDYTREKMTREEMRNLRDKLQEEINALNETLETMERNLGENSDIPDVSDEELTVLAGLSEFNAEPIQVLVKNIILNEDGNIEIIWNMDDFLQDF
ncbi:MAG: recombinase family protein [Clostridium sp.]|nr:recombinase family protein [Clostridium sp.]